MGLTDVPSQKSKDQIAVTKKIQSLKQRVRFLFGVVLVAGVAFLFPWVKPAHVAFDANEFRCADTGIWMTAFIITAVIGLIIVLMRRFSFGSGVLAGVVIWFIGTLLAIPALPSNIHQYHNATCIYISGES